MAQLPRVSLVGGYTICANTRWSKTASHCRLVLGVLYHSTTKSQELNSLWSWMALWFEDKHSMQICRKLVTTWLGPSFPKRSHRPKFKRPRLQRQTVRNPVRRPQLLHSTEVLLTLWQHRHFFVVFAWINLLSWNTFEHGQPAGSCFRTTILFQAVVGLNKAEQRSM